MYIYVCVYQFASVTKTRVQYKFQDEILTRQTKRTAQGVEASQHLDGLNFFFFHPNTKVSPWQASEANFSILVNGVEWRSAGLRTLIPR